MKVGFDIDVSKKDASSGKHKFLIRLSKEFLKRGIRVVDKKPDVFLMLPGSKGRKDAKVNVLRLDGLILNTRWDYKNKNKNILRSIHKSDAIIYQGKFCKKAYHKFLNVKKNNEIIISNGASPEEFLERSPKNYFLANCKWRPHKRLKQIVESFLLALEKGMDAELVVTGNPDYKINHHKVKFVGWQNSKNLKNLLSNAIASMHLTWLDWCPNAMVEAIVSRCPIIYSKSGGHIELGYQSGIGITDVQWDFKPVDLYSPPKLDIEEVSKSMMIIKENNMVLKEKKEIFIETIADKYIDYFRILLK